VRCMHGKLRAVLCGEIGSMYGRRVFDSVGDEKEIVEERRARCRRVRMSNRAMPQCEQCGERAGNAEIVGARIADS